MGIWSPGLSRGGFTALAPGYNGAPAQVSASCWVWNPGAASLDLFCSVGAYSSMGQFWIGQAFSEGRWGAAGIANTGALNPSPWPLGWAFMGLTFAGSTDTSLQVFFDGLQGSVGITPPASNIADAPFGVTLFESGAATPAISGPASGVAIAECVWWNGTVSIEDMLALQAGGNPLAVKSAQLLNYWPLRSDLLDRGPQRSSLVPTAAITTAPSTWWATHPTIAPPPKKLKYYLLKSSSGITGTGAPSAADASGAGVGALTAGASGAPLVPDATESAVGALTDPTMGAATGADGTASASGELADAGAGASTIPDATESGAGQVGSAVSGHGDPNAGDATAIAAGATALFGAGAASAPGETGVAEGEISALADGHPMGPVATDAAVGELSTPGAITGNASPPSVLTPPDVATGGGTAVALFDPARIVPLWPSPLRFPDKLAGETVDYALDATGLQVSADDALTAVIAAPTLTLARQFVQGGQIALLLGGGASGSDNAIDVRIGAASGRYIHRVVRLLTQ